MAEPDQPTRPLQLNIGAGHTYIPWFVNVDIADWAEVTLDLSEEPLPFPDDSVQRIVSVATLEHIPNHLFALAEMYRVLKHDGELLLDLPYVTLTEHHLVNPYHLHNFSERSFDLFDPTILKGSAAEENEIALTRAFVRFRYMSYWGAAPKPLRVWARRHLFNIVRDFEIGLVAVKNPELPVDLGAERARGMQARLSEYKAARTPYEHVQARRDAAGQARRRIAAQDPTPRSRTLGSSLAGARGRLRRRLRRFREKRTS